MQQYYRDELKQYSTLNINSFFDKNSVVLESINIYPETAEINNFKFESIDDLSYLMHLLCEGKISVDSFILNISFDKLAEIINQDVLINPDRSKIISNGGGLSTGKIASAQLCISFEEAERHIIERKDYILCVEWVPHEDLVFVESKYCVGLILFRASRSCHEAYTCRMFNKPCIAAESFERIRKFENSIVTIDGGTGNIYLGNCIIESSDYAKEIRDLKKILIYIISNNLFSAETIPALWGLWDIVFFHKVQFNKKAPTGLRIVNKPANYEYKSFFNLSEKEIDAIKNELSIVRHSSMIVEGLIEYLISVMCSKVSKGNHYLFMRPLVDPLKTLVYDNAGGTQLTGIEFFNLNKYVDSFIDIYNIKIFFSTDFFYDYNRGSYPVNYLDYTNPNGESIVFDTFNVKKLLFIINDTIISQSEVSYLYHIIRKREVMKSFDELYGFSKKELYNYLKDYNSFDKNNEKIYKFCCEQGLICDGNITLTGKSVIEEVYMKSNNNLNAILDEVCARGITNRPNDCDDYSKLLQTNEFKELVALELYDYYFWEERHEFDFQILKCLIEEVAKFFADPNTSNQIVNGLLQNLPAALIILEITLVIQKLSQKNDSNKDNHKKEKTEEENRREYSYTEPYYRIMNNEKKIEAELKNHDYIKSDDIETIFDAEKNEIEILLKLNGLKRFCCKDNRKKRIWIRKGTSERRIREILLSNKFI